jgi:DNA-binding transcriptional LysR family regulator
MERLRMLDLADLRAFIRIAELSSISAAARQLRLPKSSVSRALWRLEQTVGVTLIERSTRNLRLTDAGLLLQRHARRILDDVGEAENAMGGLIGVPQGDLRVSAPFTFAAGPLAPILPVFVQRYPAVRIILSVDNRPVDLLAEEIDIAIRIGPLKNSELIARKLANFELWLCASPAYLAKAGQPVLPADLAVHAVIANNEAKQKWEFISPSGAKSEIAFKSVAIVPEPAVMSIMLVRGAGIGLVPDFHAKAGVADGSLVRLFAGYDCGSVEAHALYPSHRSLSAKVRVFIDTLLERLSAL